MSSTAEKDVGELLQRFQRSMGLWPIHISHDSVLVVADQGAQQVNFGLWQRGCEVMANNDIMCCRRCREMFHLVEEI